MNKKVLTLCTGLLLGGSLLMTANATDVTPKKFLNAIEGYYLNVKDLKITDGVVNLTGDVTLPNTAGNGMRGQMPVVILGEGCENLKFTSSTGKTFTGHIVIATEGVTVEGLKIVNPLLTIQDGNTPLTQSTIVAFADDVTIKDNVFTTETEGSNNKANSLKGIILLPQSVDANYNESVTGNTFEGFDYLGSLSGQSWYSSAVQVLQGTKLMQNVNIKCDGYTDAMNKLADKVKGIYPRNDENKGKPTAVLSNFDAAAFMEANNLSSNTVDMIVENGGQVQEVRMNDITSDAGKEAFKQLIEEATDNAVIVVAETPLEEIQKVLEDPSINTEDKNLVIVSEDGKANIVVGDPTVMPDNDYTAVKEGESKPASWGSVYASYKTDGKTNKVVLVWRGATVKAEKDAAGNVTYTMGSYDPNSTNGNEASQYFFTLTPYELSSTDEYELRLKDNYGNFFKIGNEYVTVSNVDVQKNADGKFEYKSEATGGEWKEMDGETAVFPDKLLLKAGEDKYVTFDWSTYTFTTESNKYLAEAFGAADIQVAYMYAETLLQRYGEYFKLALVYDKNGDNEKDVTSIFEGELTPVQWTDYSAGNTWYQLADDKDQSFMLINEKNEILALTTDPKTTWSSGSDVFAYKLVTISAKQYELDRTYNGGKGYYKVNFKFEYTPGTTPSEVTSIDAIYVDDIEIGCYLDGQTPVLAGEGTTIELAPVTITLNPSAVVSAASWLNSPVYYKVTVKNANKKAQHYGKVLGLEEEGYTDYVAPENTDQNMPEGQFAITYVDNEKDQWGNVKPAFYRFTNRENKSQNFTIRANDFYAVDMAKNLFAYRDYQYNLMDTLEIAPVKDYSSEDGFKRFTAAELNANTYTVAMQLLNGDSLFVVENHNDKHRVGLDEDNATEWRIDMSKVKLMDATDDFLRYVPDTVTIETPITYYVGAPINDWVTTTLDPEAKLANKKDYKPATALKVCTYILKNTDNDEYLYGYDYVESKGNEYYVCDKYESNATRIAFKMIGDNTVNLVPAYAASNDWWDDREVYELDYENYAESLKLSYNKIIGGATSPTGVLKDETYLYKAPTNDLFVINTASAPTYKKLDQGEKIIISRLANNDEVIFEDGEFAGISNRAAYDDINPTLYVDTAYVNREGNYIYQYLLGVNIHRVDTTYQCNVPAHGIHKEDTTYGRFLVNMVDSALACKDVHNNKFVYNGQYKLAFVEGYHTNDTLFFTNEAGEVVSQMKVGDANGNIAKFAFKMIDEENNEFVIETSTGYEQKTVSGNGTEEVVSLETKPAYLRWVNGNLVVTQNLNEAERFTMEDSELNATANETIAAEGAISVVATDGAVIIKGAEGKNVVIATILGKVVANETINSDNETIAVPAGIAVVSVDGESFKVVVK